MDQNTNELISNSGMISKKFGEHFFNNSSDGNFNTQFKLFKQECEKETIVNSVNENHNDQILINHSITTNEIFHFLSK